VTLDAAMAAEGWRECGDQTTELDVFWCNPPTSQCIQVVQCRRREWRGPVWGPDPWSPDVRGYCVTLRVHDEHGNPVSGEGFWVVQRELALKLARQIREHVLGKRGPVVQSESLPFEPARERGWR
jgi:hypothetical protein